MDVIAYKIVSHSYTEETLRQNFSINEIKRNDFEWNSKENQQNPISDEISKYDLVYSIQNINNSKDEYGYFCIYEEQLPDKNYKYLVDLLLLDNKLTDSIIAECCSSVIYFLSKFHRESTENKFRIDRIIGISNLPLSPQFLNNTRQIFIKEVLQLFNSSKNGVVQLSQEQEQRLSMIAKK